MLTNAKYSPLYFKIKQVIGRYLKAAKVDSLPPPLLSNKIFINEMISNKYIKFLNLFENINSKTNLSLKFQVLYQIAMPPRQQCCQ